MNTTTISWFTIITGTALFLLGIQLMTNSSLSLFQDRFRYYIDRYTDTNFKGFLVGTIMTALIHSSSAVIIAVIALVKTKLLDNKRAAAIIIGANVGTTFTVLLFSLNLGNFIPYFLICAAVIPFVIKKKEFYDLASIAVGLGLMHLGISYVSGHMQALLDIPQIQNISEFLGNFSPAALLSGVVISVLTRSSDAAIGLLELCYEGGVISFLAAVPFLFGANIGTCFQVIYAFGHNNSSGRQAAGFHLLFNIAGAALGMALMGLIDRLGLLNALSMRMQIAIIHVLFNVVMTLIMLPLIDPVCDWLKRIIKGEDEQNIHLDEQETESLQLPAVCLSIAYHNLTNIIELLKANVALTREYVTKGGDETVAEQIHKGKKKIRSYDLALQRYLVRIPGHSLSNQAVNAQTFYLGVCRNLERIVDLNCNVADFIKMIRAEDEKDFSPTAIKEIDNMYNMFFLTLDKALQFHKSWDIKYYKETVELEDRTDAMESTYRRNHIYRLRNNECASISGAAIYSDILSCLERMNDHCCIIAHNALDRMQKIKNF